MLWVLGAYASSPKKILTKRCILVRLVYILIRLCLEKLRVEFLPEEMTFFRTGGRKWKKLISSISSAEDLEESRRFGRKWNKWNITNI